MVDEAQRALQGDDEAVVTMLRGHLEVTGITTVDALAATTGLVPGRVASGLAVLEQEGFAFRGRYTPGATDEEWVARRLLARMHAGSRRRRRDRVQPATAQELMRFLLRWQHVAPDTQLAGEGGLAAVIEQLEGYEAAAGSWEPEVLARRLRDYRPGWLDRLCHDGEVSWLRLMPRRRDDNDAPAGSPSKATPITVVLRADLGWLLAAARDANVPVPPSVGATAEVIEVLRRRGACFAVELAEATRRLPDDVERALWDGVSRGLLTSDGFAAIRARVTGERHSSLPPRHSRLRRAAAVAASGAGRWSLVPTAIAEAGADLDRDELAEAVAELLLQRWGILFRDLAVHDSLRFPWRDIQWALRRLEDRGLVRGGRFVAGFSGEQYALPNAVEQLDRIRKSAPSGERVTINATDPLNLVGVLLPGDKVPAIRTNQVSYVDGIPA